MNHSRRFCLPSPPLNNLIQNLKEHYMHEIESQTDNYKQYTDKKEVQEKEHLKYKLFK
jgi:hypothetical protein